MKNPVKVRILGHEYLIKSDEDEAQVHSIAQFVSDKFKEIKSNTEGLSERKAALLVAFDIAGDYFQAIRERDEMVTDIQRRAKILNYGIDSAVK